MTLRQFLRMCRGPVAACAVTASGFAQETLVTNSARFQIPFEIETAAGESPQGFAVLFGSQNGGATWERLQTVPASQQHFQFAAPRDGIYAFAVRMMDAQGNLMSSVEGSRPELQVSIDTTAPELRLQLLESAPGQLFLNWQISDPNLEVKSLTLEYTEGQDGRWKKIEAAPVISGRVPLEVSEGTVISVRGAVMDSAGNRGTATTEVVLKARSGVRPDFQIAATPQSGNSVNVEPIGVNPFSQQHSGFDNLSIGTTNETPKTSRPTAAAQTGFNAAEAFVPETAVPLTNPATRFQRGAAAPADRQLVNNCVFDLVYEVQDVGPSGVGAVELFVTEDGGQQWFRYGNDTDLQSPLQVDVQGEGTFGFAVRVRNGLGIADPPPQPGEAPAIVVTVDQTAPLVKFSQPTVIPEGNGLVVLKWEVSDQNPSPAPIRLEYAESGTGPWKPIFDWQQDTGSLRWPVPQGSSPALHFRLLACDAAGNVSTQQSAQPVLIDMKRPTVSGLRVQAVSNARKETRGF